MHLAVGKHGQHVAVDGLAVHGDGLHAAAHMAGVVDGDLVGRATEAAADLIAIPTPKWSYIHFMRV